ncbi:NUDIX hydrolase [Actinocorallia aurea]
MTPDTDPRENIRALIRAIPPGDDTEAADIARTLAWIDSGAPLFRTAWPATPPKHLVVYSALLDESAGTLLLVDHVRSGLWLPPGGHVDDDEDPRLAVLRELREELGLRPRFHPAAGAAPFFLAINERVPPHAHTDVCLWFLFVGDERAPVVPDPSEICTTHWFPVADAAGWATDSDPAVERFLAKVAAVGAASTGR